MCVQRVSSTIQVPLTCQVWSYSPFPITYSANRCCHLECWERRSGLLSKATVATENFHLGKWIWKCSFSKLAFNFHCCEITCALQTLFESRFFTVIRGLCLDTCPATDRQTSRQGDKTHRTICLLRVLTYRKRLWLSRETATWRGTKDTDKSNERGRNDPKVLPGKVARKNPPLFFLFKENKRK